MALKLTSNYIDAKNRLEEALEHSTIITKKEYGVLFSTVCELVDYSIEPIAGDLDDSPANLKLTIAFNENLIVDDKLKKISRNLVLHVLSNKGDTVWTHAMITKVWDGNYPSAVAVDPDTGEVYLINIMLSGLELVMFGEFDKYGIEAFNADINDTEPYRIGIDEDAMFRVLDGAEGNNYLKYNIYVEFNTIVKIRVYPRNRKLGVF